jgi:serine/threonine protein phosphatase PrpC
MQGWRISMEDAKLVELALEPDAACFGVYDGHGGKEVAIFVSRHLGEELVKNPKYQSGRYDQALIETYLKLDTMLMTESGRKELYRICKDLPDSAPVSADDLESIAGCTAVTALVKGSTLYVANAGDSRCVLAKKGRAIEMTVDHKPDLPSERDRIYRAGGSVEDGRVMGNLNLSRSIGDLEYKRNHTIPPEDQMITACPEIHTETIDRDTDFMILACDGIWDMLTSQQCVDFVYQRLGQKPLNIIVEEILDRCLASDVATSGGLGCDNMTCVLVVFKDTTS